MELYIIRHGQSQGNIPFEGERSKTDRNDPLLTPLGVAQTELLGKRFCTEALTAIIASPLMRAVGTAHAVAVRQPANGAKRVELLPDMMEEGTDPDYEGRPFAQVLEAYPTAVECTAFPTPAGGGKCIGAPETTQDTMERALRVIRFIRKRFASDEKVMLVAHGSFNQYLIAAALGYTKRQSYNFCQENTCVTKIRYFPDGRVRLTLMDDLSHLYADYPQLQFEL